MAYKVFADANVYLDFLLQRGSEWKNSEAIFQLAEQNKIEVYTSASNLLNLIYIMGNYKLLKTEIVSHSYAILNYSILANPDNATFEAALASSFTDLEDAVQYFTALKIKGLDYFITSNIKDYKKATHLPVFTPKQFMSYYQK
jgi:predicted nucleic acid-binding protein